MSIILAADFRLGCVLVTTSKSSRKPSKMVASEAAQARPTAAESGRGLSLGPRRCLDWPTGPAEQRASEQPKAQSPCCRQVKNLQCCCSTPQHLWQPQFPGPPLFVCDAINASRDTTAWKCQIRHHKFVRRRRAPFCVFSYSLSHIKSDGNT